LAALNGSQRGDPKKGVARVFEVVTETEMGAGLGDILRLPLGMDAWQRLEKKTNTLQDVLYKTEEIAGSTDF
jgi:hypothetical protein